MSPAQFIKFSWQGLALVTWLAASVSPADAMTRYGQVMSDGRVMYSSSPMVSGKGIQPGCESSDAIFTFAESVSSSQLSFQRLDAGSDAGRGQISISVSITSVCRGSGTATFRYRHAAEEGAIGTDIDIDPVSPALVLELVEASSGSAAIEYSIRTRTEDTSDEDKRFALLASELSFVSGDLIGQASREVELATIVLAEDPALQGGAVQPGRRDGGRVSAAIVAFNEACFDPSAVGSTFLEICREAQNSDNPDVTIQVAEAFDAHEIAALTAASSEGIRIQRDNINSRMSALRSGASGVSIEGVALAYGGQSFDMSWLPVEALDAVNEEGGGGGSSLMSERVGVFVNGNVAIGDRDRRGKEVGFGFDSWGLTAGVDYRFGNGAVAGLAAGFSRYEADLDRGRGSVESDTFTLQAYGTYNFSDDLYLDMTLGYTGGDVEQNRVVDLTGVGNFGRTIARGETDSTQFFGSLALNYRLDLVQGWDTVLFGEAFLADNQIDGFTESGSPFDFSFPDQDFTTQTLSAGLRVSRAIGFSRGVMVPFADVWFSHEGGNDGFILRPTLVETGAFGPQVEISNPDRNFGKLDLGASWVFLSGNQLFVSYGLLFGESDTAMQSFHVGARFEF